MTYKNLGLPPEWYGAVEWVFPTWARTHALDTGQAVNSLKGAVVTVDRILTVSKVIILLGICLLGGVSSGEILVTALVACTCFIAIHLLLLPDKFLVCHDFLVFYMVRFCVLVAGLCLGNNNSGRRIWST